MDTSELIRSIDIVELASLFVDLEEKNGEYWGISPFTFPPENTPSFSVRRESGSFYDFSSGIGGTAVTLIQNCKKLSKSEAIKWLIKYAGGDGNNLRTHENMSATSVCKKFAPNVKKKRAGNMAGYGEDCMERFEIADDKLKTWESEGISRETLATFQVRYDRFSDRLVYPIKNENGKIVNIGGRTLDPEWKQKKLRKYTYLYKWGGSMSVVYGIFENMQYIRKRKEVIVFEGCKSVLIANTWGIKNTAALLTSHLSPEQMKILAKLGCRVVFALDKEINIKKDHNIERLKRYVKVEYLIDKDGVLENKDSPVDKGKEVFLQLYSDKRCFK